MKLMLVIAVVLLFACMFAEGKQTQRRFVAKLCRLVGTPKKVETSNTAANCILRCYNNHWCHGVNFRRLAKQCELFDKRAVDGDLDGDSNCIYYEDPANIQYRTYVGNRNPQAVDLSVSLTPASSVVDAVFDCTHECRSRQWCTRFNVNPKSGQCGLFKKFLLAIPMLSSLAEASVDDVAGVIDQLIPESMPTDGLRNGSRLSVTFRTLDAVPPGVDNTALIKISSGADTALQISIRLDDSKVVRNSKINKKWQAEENDGVSPFSANNLFTFELVNRGLHFELIVNGATFTTFVHRVDPYTIDAIAFKWWIARNPFECRIEYDY